MYRVHWNQAAAAYSSLYFFIFLSLQVSNIKNFSSHFSQELWGQEDWNFVHTWTVGRRIVYTGIRLLLLIYPFISSFFFLSNFQTVKIFIILFSGTVRPRRLKLGTYVDNGWMYRSCIPESGCCCLFIPLFLPFFFLSNFQTLKFFVTLFSGPVRPRRLKLVTHMDTGQMYHVHQNQAAAAYSSLYFFIFLSLQFSNIKFFVTLFSGTVRPERLKLGTHVEDSVQMYRVYRNQAAAAYLSLYFFISNFQTLKIFVTLFSETVRPIKLTLDTHVDNGWMYRVYRNQAVASYLSLISLSPMFKNLKFSSHFSQELWRQKSLNLVHLQTMGGCILYTRIRLLLLICPFISSFFFLSNYQTFTIFVTFFSGTVRPRKLKLGTHVDNGCMYHVYRN